MKTMKATSKNDISLTDDEKNEAVHIAEAILEGNRKDKEHCFQQYQAKAENAETDAEAAALWESAEQVASAWLRVRKNIIGAEVSLSME